MRGTGRVSWLLMCALFAGIATGAFVFGASPAVSVNVANTGYVLDDDDDAPDVTSRVARVSFIRGEAKIKHVDSSDWEKVTLNLPIVGGDEIVTESDSRVEIQFDNQQHLRLAENSALKVTTLEDRGIAVSISLGTMSLRITKFDKDRSFFEIDAPKTTLAVQKSGTYRIDAGKAGDADIRMTATDGGEARVYSDTAGFTLKNDRSARVFIDGLNAGEWEAAQASQFSDEFDTWALDRDSTIARRMADAYYDKYYDADIYGADDLNGNGEWVFTSSYGYVWRPYASAINVYADWSPYRYGHWRWIPPYGWTWINDEPWGWATYHHGRWFYDAGYWYWSPYGYYRHSRSWWFPALVSITIYNNNVCWYPLPYHCHYQNYNGHHGHQGGGHHSPDPVITGGIKPIPAPIPTKSVRPQTGGIRQPPVTTVPTKAVISVATASFGTTVKAQHAAPLSLANSVLATKPDELGTPPLPVRASLVGKLGTDIVRERPRADVIVAQTKVGAAVRQQGEPLDKELRSTRVFGGRTPAAQGDTGGVRPVNGGAPDTRPTGAVTRPPVKHDTDPPVGHMPPQEPQPTVKTPRSDPPVKQQPPIQYDPPVRQPTRSEPPVKQPSYSPPPKQEPAPVRTPPRSDPPTKSEPKPSPPSKSDSGGGASKKASKSD